MFDVTCPTLDQAVLIWPSRIIGVDNRDGVIDLAFTCACGALAVLRTGAGAHEALVAHHHADAAALV